MSASVAASPGAAPAPSSTPRAAAADNTGEAAHATVDDPPETDAVEASVDWQAFVPTDTADHLATMDRAARESNCGVPWQLLAAIARVESDFGRNMATSSAGAIGYGQFLPSSWQSFGGDGNVYDYRDALPAIALYLCQSGLDRDPRKALFAYNHANWYVDMVLDLAVRYDRMAPGAPTPDVLNVGPAAQQSTTLQYALGRDTRLESRQRTLEPATSWLGIPWRGRTVGQPIAPDALEVTTLSMLRLGFGLRGDAPALPTLASSENLAPLADAAWDNGLLGIPGEGPHWSASELRQHLRLSQPVIVFVNRKGLPGHPPDESDGEQPLLLIGTTPSGFIYNDPTFSSSLGYGLELGEPDLLKFWDAAARPRQALAFVARPQPAARQAHVADASAPEPIARQTATPLPAATPTAAPIPTEAATAVPEETATLEPVPTAVLVAAAHQADPEPGVAEWGALLAGVFGVAGGAALVLRRLFGRQSS
jgi:hypothetical protein